MAGKVFVTGDCHGKFRKFNKSCFAEQTELDKDDYVIICGDFGAIWNVGWENKNEKYWLDWLNDRPYTTLFCDGNHENFDRLYGYPIKEWHGGKVHEIRPSVLHLMRGEIFNLNGKSFFVFGGAASHDINDGILSTEDPEFKAKKKFLDDIGGMYRINHLTWWEKELPSLEEIENASKNLEKHDFSVDYIITHCIFPNIQKMLLDEPEENELTLFLQSINEHVGFKQWFFGHYHSEAYFSETEKFFYDEEAESQKYCLLYDSIKQVI